MNSLKKPLSLILVLALLLYATVSGATAQTEPLTEEELLTEYFIDVGYEGEPIDSFIQFALFYDIGNLDLLRDYIEDQEFMQESIDLLLAVLIKILPHTDAVDSVAAFCMMTAEEQAETVEILEKEISNLIDVLNDFLNNIDDNNEPSTNNDNTIISIDPALIVSMAETLIEILPSIPPILIELGAYYNEVANNLLADFWDWIGIYIEQDPDLEFEDWEDIYEELQEGLNYITHQILCFYFSNFSLWNDVPVLEYPFSELFNSTTDATGTHSLQKSNYEDIFMMNEAESSDSLEYEIVTLIKEFLGIREAGEYNLVSDEDFYPEGYTGYIWPIRPGKIEWLELNDHLKKIEVLQIPEDVLANMSTSELVQTVISYPLNGDLFSYESTEAWFEITSKRFNGLEKLLQQPDAATLLLDNFASQNYIPQDELDLRTQIAFRSNGYVDISTDKGSNACRRLMDMQITRLFINQTYLYEQLSLSEREYFAELVLEKETSARQSPSIYGSKTKDLNSINADTEYDSQEDTVGDRSLSAEEPSNIGAEAGNANSTYASDIKGPWSYFGAVVYYRDVQITASGVTLTARDIVNEVDAYLLSMWDNYDHNSYPHANRLRPATIFYDCHSFAWYSNVICNYVVGFDSRFLSTQYEETDTCAVNDRIVYRANGWSNHVTHSGIVTTSAENREDVWITSKWGGGGLYEHSIKDNPWWAGWNDIEFYTKK